MKKAIYLFASMALVMSVISCKTEPAEIDEEIAEIEVCNYSYDDASTEFEWTAFKTTEKKGVPGTFNDVEVTSESGNDPKEVIESITFCMNTASVETQNEERNGKVAKHFFETINTETIEGTIKSLGEDGKATLEVAMNEISVDVEGEYTLEDNVFTFETSIDVSAWNALAGIEALNTVCSDLHTGEDGVSKLWSEVKLTLKTTLKSDCD
ncbi:MAG TPA: YceI family protein [Crocinitomicaceae bacterium]|nr:YceI family protein [Crocinitomicaceae bacterium]